MDELPPGLRRTLTLLGRCRQVAATVLAVLLLTLGSLAALLVAALTLFRARRPYAEGPAGGLARLAWCRYGVGIVQHRPRPLTAGQVVFGGNHWSLLVPFVVIALGLPNCRYFMSVFLQKVVPLGIGARLCGTLWMMPQTVPERRRLFQDGAALLRRTGESI